jgi:MFS family permease
MPAATAESRLPAATPAVADGGTARTGRARERVTLAGITLVISVAAFEAIAVATALPTTARALHGVGLFGWSFTAFLLADIVGLVDAGARVDRHGPATSLVGGLAMFAAGLVVDGLAPDMGVFLAGRALQGFGAGAFIVAVYVLVARVFPDERRARVFAVMSGAWVVPSLVGPAFAGAVTATVGWRWVFLGIAPLAALGAALLLPVTRAVGGGTGRDGSRRLGTTGGLLLAGGLGLGQLAGQRLDRWAPLLLAFGLAAVALPLRRMLPRGSWRLRPGLPTVVLLRGIYSIAFFGAEAYLPLTLTRLHHGTPATVGIPLTVAAVGWASGSWWQSRGTTRPERLLGVGFALVGVGVAALVAVTFTAVTMWVAAPLWALAGFGMGLGYPTVSVLTLRLSPPAEQGANSASLQVCDVMGGIIGVATAATLVAAAGTTQLALAMRIADPLLAAATLAGVGLSRRAVSTG